MSHPPFMNSYGLIEKIFDKLKSAATPPRFTQDFLGSKLGFSGGSAKAFIPFLKRLGFLGSDGVPTDLYKRFRNTSESGAAMAEAMRNGYGEVFSRNEYAHELSDQELRGLIVQITGLEESATTVGAIVKSFLAVKNLADFDATEDTDLIEFDEPDDEPTGYSSTPPPQRELNKVGIGLSYTINLNLPETTNVAVFNAIFKSLKENLLKG